jgi:hypothetical protein
MGRVNVLSERIPLTADYGTRDLSIIQSRSQLDVTYGADGMISASSLFPHGPLERVVSRARACGGLWQVHVSAKR